MQTKVSIDLLKLKCRVTSYKIRCVGLTCASAKVTYSPKWRSRAITPEATDTTANTTASKRRRALEGEASNRSQGPLACRDPSSETHGQISAQARWAGVDRVGHRMEEKRKGISLSRFSFLPLSPVFPCLKRMRSVTGCPDFLDKDENM